MLKNLIMILIAGMFIIVTAKLSFAMMCDKHGSGEQLTQTHSEHEQAAASATRQEAGGSGEAVNVGNKICPVSGEKVDEKTKVTYEYAGKIYNFCCAACIEDFKKDPQRYAKKVKEELQAVPSSKTNAGAHSGHHSGV